MTTNSRAHNYYPAQAIIDLAAISGNVAALAERAPTAAVMAVVKADAYGHGLVPSAKAAIAGGATWLGTAQIGEALALRAAGCTQRILTWLYGPGAPLGELIGSNIDISVSAEWALEEVAAAAQQCEHPARVHLKIDTGLSRNGVLPEQLPELLRRAREFERAGLMRVVGVWSHLAFADEPAHPSVMAQTKIFDDAVQLVEHAGCNVEVRHLANSAATLTNPRAHYDLVRPGLAIYGLSPVPQLADAGEFGLRAAMTLEAQLVNVKPVPAGSGVSYGHGYVNAADTVLGLVPLGYADGIPRHASGVTEVVGVESSVLEPAVTPRDVQAGAPVRIGGGNSARTLRVAGRVCMDQFVLDLGSGAAEQVGDTVVLFGDSRLGLPSAQDWAEAAGTISYEITTRLGSRVPRVYQSLEDL